MKMRLNPCKVRLNIETNIPAGGKHGPDGGGGWGVGVIVGGQRGGKAGGSGGIWYLIFPIWYPISSI